MNEEDAEESLNEIVAGMIEEQRHQIAREKDIDPEKINFVRLSDWDYVGGEEPFEFEIEYEIEEE